MHLEVVTPRGSLLSTETDEVIAPGVMGELGILPGHIPFFSALRAGAVRYRQSGSLHTLHIGRGFLEVTPSKGIVILASEASVEKTTENTAA